MKENADLVRWGVSNGLTSTVDKFLTEGGCSEVKNRHGVWSLLHIAHSHDNQDMVRCLLSHGLIHVRPGRPFAFFGMAGGIGSRRPRPTRQKKGRWPAHSANVCRSPGFHGAPQRPSPAPGARRRARSPGGLGSERGAVPARDGLSRSAKALPKPPRTIGGTDPATCI